ncbi:hypothetical protein OURE66S_04578 [Oligella ureolytica]
MSQVLSKLAEQTLLAAETLRYLDIKPKAALLSRSNFGSMSSLSSKKMQHALSLIHALLGNEVVALLAPTFK